MMRFADCSTLFRSDAMTTYRRLGPGVFLMAACLVTLAGRGAGAQERIGAAGVVRNEVSGTRGGRNVAIAAGDDVFRDQAVQTGADSVAKLVFLDDTNLSLGPSARIVLDRYVFAGESSASRVAVSLTRGAFRFVTGGSDKRAYEIRTPVATIGIRGTVFDLRTTGSQTVVTLEEGEVRACVRGTSRCAVLNTPGQTVAITLQGVRFLSPGSPGAVGFGALCGADPALCTPTRFASGLRQTTAALCGR